MDLIRFDQATRCTVNTQHNCADNACPVTKSRNVLQEREKTANLALAVTHKSPTDIIMNTGQMRDAAIISPFRTTIPILNRDNIISAAAKRETDARKEQKRKNEDATARAMQMAAISGPSLRQQASSARSGRDSSTATSSAAATSRGGGLSRSIQPRLGSSNLSFSPVMTPDNYLSNQ